jgi:hypothetical protein
MTNEVAPAKVLAETVCYIPQNLHAQAKKDEIEHLKILEQRAFLEEEVREFAKDYTFPFDIRIKNQKLSHRGELIHFVKTQFELAGYHTSIVYDDDGNDYIRIDFQVNNNIISECEPNAKRSKIAND